MWLAEPAGRDVMDALHRLCAAPDVQQVAVMPDVHLASEVCIGVAMATSHLLYPQAVGGDIGCGMLAIATDIEASAITPRMGTRILQALQVAIPSRRHNRKSTVGQPESLRSLVLSHPSLEALRRAEGAIEFATLGSGNHFLELQRDEEQGRLWLMIHSGSRAMGPAIRDHHLRVAEDAKGLRWLDANSASGEAYLQDAAYARAYADASRRAMAAIVGEILKRNVGGSLDEASMIVTDHNHVERTAELWIHRKGAMAAYQGVAGVLPGSMGTLSYHVEGRGHAPALWSSAHGAGRRMSRTEARRKVSQRELQKQMGDVCYDSRLTNALLEEAPCAYKDIRSVLRAQSDLVKVTRVLRPVLTYKGT
ncbi:RNA-splicing ligase RtcB [Bryobacterales bacterium F-183]|nr:RNA-splicing ligase RtcB [Bryobacterales bacterium F-183]